MSKLRANQLTDKASTGAPTAPNGLVVTGVSTATSFSGSGANLTSIPAGNLTGTVADARLSTVSASKLSGALPAISGANLTNLDASDLASGTIPDARFPSTLPAVSGANLTGIQSVVKSVHSKVDGGRHAVSTQLQNNAYTSATSWSQMEITITPQSTSSKFHITGCLNITHHSDYSGNIMISYQPSGASEYFLLANSNGSIRRTFKGEAGNNFGSDMMSPMPLDLIVEPNTTQATLFRIRLSTLASSRPWYLNRTSDNTTNNSDGGDCLSSWTITELDGSSVTVGRTTAQTYTQV